MSGASIRLERRLRRMRPEELRRLAARQAQRNLYGSLEAGGIGCVALRTIDAVEGGL